MSNLLRLIGRRLVALRPAGDRPTDVAERPRFTARRTTKTIDGRPVTGWFTEDFTLAELKTLRAKERLPLVRPGNTVYDGRFAVPTFDEVLDLARRESLRRGRPIGVAPETKHPTYFRSIGKNLENPLVRTLNRRGLNHRRSPVTVQSFETANLQALSRRLRAPLAQNVSASGSPYDRVAAGDPTTYADMVTAKGLRALSRYADILSAEKDVLIPRTADGALAEPTEISGETLSVKREGDAAGDVKRTRADVTRAEEELGWRPTTSLEDGLRAQWDWVAGRVAAL